MRQTLMLAVDGTEPAELRKIMSVCIESAADIEDRLPSVFESAAGFSPTIGILGAVLGLIQVMQHLDNLSQVGRGIAVDLVVMPRIDLHLNAKSGEPDSNVWHRITYGYRLSKPSPAHPL